MLLRCENKQTKLIQVCEVVVIPQRVVPAVAKGQRLALRWVLRQQPVVAGVCALLMGWLQRAGTQVTQSAATAPGQGQSEASTRSCST